MGNLQTRKVLMVWWQSHPMDFPLMDSAGLASSLIDILKQPLRLPLQA
jgi:hypothetical protein